MFPARLHAAVKRLAHEGLARAALDPRGPRPGALAAVLDTHVWMECLYWRGCASEALARSLHNGRIEPVLSEAALMELAGILSRPVFGAQEEAVLQVLEAAAERALWSTSDALEAAAAELETEHVRCRDPEDQKFLTLARASGAKVLFTRDRLLTKAAKKLRKSGVVTMVPEMWREPPPDATGTEA